MSSLNENVSQYISSGVKGEVVFRFVNCQKVNHASWLSRIKYTYFWISQPVMKLWLCFFPFLFVFLVLFVVSGFVYLFLL